MSATPNAAVGDIIRTRFGDSPAGRARRGRAALHARAQELGDEWQRELRAAHWEAASAPAESMTRFAR